LFPNAPTATGTFANDRIAGSDYGHVTSQVELRTPIWLPGEGTVLVLPSLNPRFVRNGETQGSASF
jgi:hypothetical protein